MNFIEQITQLQVLVPTLTAIVSAFGIIGTVSAIFGKFQKKNNILASKVKDSNEQVSKLTDDLKSIKEVLNKELEVNSKLLAITSLAWKSAKITTATKKEIDAILSKVSVDVVQQVKESLAVIKKTEKKEIDNTDFTSLEEVVKSIKEGDDDVVIY